MPFAVIQTGGKQYEVSEGDLLTIEKLPGEHKIGDSVTFDQVLLTDTGTEISIGSPYLSSAKVSATVESIGRKPKVTIIKYKAKSRYFKKRGHRQPAMKVRIGKLT
jgi:large subunit ribosomal protein L21